VLADPTVKVALITGGTAIVAVIISGGFAMLVHKLERNERLADRLADEVKRKAEHEELMAGQAVIQGSVDGAAKILRDKYDAASTRADQAEGEARGIESERTREPK
jgi:hypothetical protein